VVEIGRQEETAPARRTQHPVVVGDVEAAAPVRPHPPDRRQDLDRLTDHATTGLQPRGQLLLGRHPVAGAQPGLGDELEDPLGDHLVPWPVRRVRLDLHHARRW
jgi:hypothetical protein